MIQLYLFLGWLIIRVRAARDIRLTSVGTVEGGNAVVFVLLTALFLVKIRYIVGSAAIKH